MLEARSLAPCNKTRVVYKKCDEGGPGVEVEVNVAKFKNIKKKKKIYTYIYFFKLKFSGGPGLLSAPLNTPLKTSVQIKASVVGVRSIVVERPTHMPCGVRRFESHRRRPL